MSIGQQVEAALQLIEMLAKSEVPMSVSADLLDDAAFETDPDGRLVFVNSAWTHLLGQSIEDSLGQPALDYVNLTGRIHVAELLASRDGPARQILTTINQSDDQRTCVLLTAAPTSRGGTVGVLQVVASTTAAEKSVSLLSIAIHSTNSLVVITDEVGQILWVNPAFEVRTGWTLPEVVGRSPGSFLQGPGTDPATIERFRYARRERLAIREEILNYTKAGDPYWSDVQITPVTADGGRWSRFVSIQTDTTDQRRHTQEIANNQKLLEFRVKSRTEDFARSKEEAEEAVRANIAYIAELTLAHEALVDAQEQRRILLKRLRTMSGQLGGHHATDRSVGTILSEMDAFGQIMRVDKVIVCTTDSTGGMGFEPDVRVTPEEGDIAQREQIPGTVVRLLQELAIHPRIFSVPRVGNRWNNVASDGLTAFIDSLGFRSAIVCPFSGSDSIVRGAIILGRWDTSTSWTEDDVTLVEATGQYLSRALADSLHREAQQQLVVELRDLDRVKNDIISTFSHELRTPLACIKAYAELLREGHTEALGGAAHMIEVIERNVARLTSLVDDVLTLTHISDTSDVRMMPLTFDLLVESVCKSIAAEANNKQIEFEIKTAAGHTSVLGNESQLERMLFNLLSNAVKFTPSGGRITISTRSSGTELVLSVADTGIGIPAGEDEHVLKRFYRASNAMETSIPGTGLGLAIVKAIVHHHAGSIRLSSLIGSGTVASVRIPILSDPMRLEPARSIPAS
ncbi:MAG: PAS domain-containing protein [Actinobacteria bacterium]|nr:PAS domain-containing protein [Actinomycetota bacterium]